MLIITGLRRHSTFAWLMHDLSVRQTARAEGHGNPPEPHNGQYSQTELAIEARFNDRHGTLDRNRDRALHSERLAVIESLLAEDQRTIPAIVTNTKAVIDDSRLEPFNPAWNQAKVDIIGTGKELDDFKRDNLIARDAHDPDPMFAIGVGALAFVSETAVNAVLFSKVLEGALIDGATVSATLSAPNIALGFLAGFFGLRACHDIRPAVRRLGAAVTGLAISTAVAWNLYVGQLRALAEARAAVNQPLSAADWRTAGANLIADPSAPFQSGPALTLVLIGLVVFAVALWDGLDGFSDRVPGLSRLSRRHQRAIAHAQALKARFFAVLDRFTRRGIRGIERRHRAVHTNLAIATRILGRAARIIIHFNERLADQLWVHRQALFNYYRINRHARGERDVPDRFRQQPLPRAPQALPAFDWLAMHDKLERLAAAACASAQTATDELNAYRRRIKTELDAELAAATASPLPLSPYLLPAPAYP